jgi:WD40 repeat protein
LLWNEPTKSLLTCHGFGGSYIKMWELSNENYQLGCKFSLTAHNGRILNMVQSRDQNYVCTVSSDETMKFWCLKDGSDPFSDAKK